MTQYIVKVISLYPPWGSLIVKGHKPVETRRRAFNYRGRLYIHQTAELREDTGEICRSYPFNRYVPDASKLPLGKIIGYCDVVDCFPTTVWTADDSKLLKDKYGKKWLEVLAFGDFSESRYGAELEDFCEMEKPIPARGFPWPFDFDITNYI